MVMTRNGIYYNLFKSTYKCTHNGITFVFSSKNHLEKFEEKLTENRNLMAYSLYKRYKLWFICDELFDLVLYKKVETRGFLVNIKGEDITCLESLQLNGVSKIAKR